MVIIIPNVGDQIDHPLSMYILIVFVEEIENFQKTVHVEVYMRAS